MSNCRACRRFTIIRLVHADISLLSAACSGLCPVHAHNARDVAQISLYLLHLLNANEHERERYVESFVLIALGIYALYPYILIFARPRYIGKNSASIRAYDTDICGVEFIVFHVLPFDIYKPRTFIFRKRQYVGTVLAVNGNPPAFGYETYYLISRHGIATARKSYHQTIVFAAFDKYSRTLLELFFFTNLLRRLVYQILFFFPELLFFLFLFRRRTFPVWHWHTCSESLRPAKSGYTPRPTC